MITALGLRYRARCFNVDKLRYHRIIIMSVDGNDHVFVKDDRGACAWCELEAFIDTALAGM